MIKTRHINSGIENKFLNFDDGVAVDGDGLRKLQLRLSRASCVLYKSIDKVRRRLKIVNGNTRRVLDAPETDLRICKGIIVVKAGGTQRKGRKMA